MCKSISVPQAKYSYPKRNNMGIQLPKFVLFPWPTNRHIITLNRHIIHYAEYRAFGINALTAVAMDISKCNNICLSLLLLFGY